MLKVFIQGLKDGEYEIDLECPVDQIPDMFEEFVDIVRLKGKLRILGRRYNISAKAECSAQLVCDVSLNEYVETISADINLAFIADELLWHAGKDQARGEVAERAIHPDDKHIDVTEDVREELAVNLPMKRVSPEYRDKDLKEVYPEYSPEKVKAPDDDRWAALKNLKFNN
jgi:uncharacterized metal-binding protein YceD (DUF177 family)